MKEGKKKEGRKVGRKEGSEKSEESEGSEGREGRNEGRKEER